MTNGEYEFDYINLQDNANRNNQIRYEDDGTTQYYDNQINNTVYGTHDLNLDNLTITVTGGREPRTDYSAPTLNSVSFSKETDLNEFDATAGERFEVYYDAEDISGISNAQIRFKNETGLEIYGYDYDDDGVITINPNSDLPNGLYTFVRFSASDYQNNSGTLRENGIYEFYDSEYSEQVYQLYDAAFEGLSLNISGGSEEQTDFTPPVLSSVRILQENVEKGSKINIFYEASDVGSGVNQAQVRFKDANNSSIHGYDYDNDGVITIDISDSQSGGEYFFDYFTLSDNAYQSNQITYRSDGVSEYSDRLNNNETVRSNYTVDVAIGPDDIPTELNDISTISETENNGSFGTANSISNNTIATGTIVRGDDYFKFNIESPGLITVGVDVAGGLGSLKLFDEDENILVTEGVSDDGTLIFNAINSGDYYILLSEFTSSYDYSLSLNIINDPVTLAVTVIQDDDGNNKYAINGEILETIELGEIHTYLTNRMRQILAILFYCQRRKTESMVVALPMM